VKKFSFFPTAFKDLYVSRLSINPIVIPQAAHQDLGTCFHVGFLRFTPPLCNYSRNPSMWDLQFSSASHLRASKRKWGSQFKLGEVEPSFKEFLASPAMMRLGLMIINPDVGCTKLFPACYFLRVMPLWFCRLILSCFIELSL
jgi:hypothetical protein